MGRLFAVCALLVGACTGEMKAGSDAPARDAGTRSDSGTAPDDDAGTMPPGDGGADTDAGTPPARETPGGEPGTAPIVGCEEADRPARALESVETPVCEAVGGGRCWYVAPGGADGAAGTFDDPLAKPQDAVRGAGPGDVIYLRGGVYGMANASPTSARTWDDPSAGLRYSAVHVGRVSLPSWAGAENYQVASGTEDAPITVRSYPGERACIDGGGGVEVGALSHEIAYWHIEDLTIHGASIGIGGGSKGAGDAPVNQVHHIYVDRNEVYDHAGQMRNNTGLVRIDRGDWGGPYEIHVRSNILHDLYVIEDGVRKDWTDTTDAQHFGGVATLSCETYMGVECVGNGRLVVWNNLIYRVPSALFFKNPSQGPFEVSDNVIHDARMMGKWAPAHVTFQRNLVYGVRGGIVSGEFGGADLSSPVGERAGHDLRILDNTLVGFGHLVSFWITGAGHTIRGNVIEGLRDPVGDARWETPGYVSRRDTFAGYSDTGSDISGSQLAESDFDANCFVTSTPDFIAASRYRDTGGTWDLEHLSLDEARAALGMETGSVVESDPDAVFVGFDAGDYTVRSDGPCAAMGRPTP